MSEDYYNHLAKYYKLFYSDWDSSVKRQADALDQVIKEYGKADSLTVLDAACGIGTQTIGLASLGYQLTASDLSAAEIELARKEAAARDLEVDFHVADMRRVWDYYQRQFDVLIACDNSIPHLLDNSQILTAFIQFFNCVETGGICLISVRDYSKISRKTEFNPRTVHRDENGSVVMFDIWHFEGDIYEMTTYIVEDTGSSEAVARVFRGGKYYCVELPTLVRLLHEAGFGEIKIFHDRFFQPLIVARK